MRFLGGSNSPSQSAQVGTTASPSTTNTNTNRNSSGETVTLTYWGLWENDRVMREVLADFEAQNPGIKVNYQKQNYRDYRERLQTAIASGRGPDVFRFHASWVPMIKSELDPAPSSVITPSAFRTQYYPVAAEQLITNNQVVGIPMMYDGLGLFYNQDIFRTANATVPSTWTDVRSLAQRLTIRNENRIERAGIALGNSTNVEHFADVIGLLMLQNGANLSQPSSQEAQDALRFYTSFVTEDKVWDAALPSSTVAFARGEAAMMLAPSWRAHDIKSLNPNLNFAIAPVPQISSQKVAWATYWAEGVSAQSRRKSESWKLINYLSQAETLRKLYSAASTERSFGPLYPRPDMANQLAASPYAAAYLQDAPYAKSWYLNTFTHDNGLNDLLIKYYEDAVTAATGQSSRNLEQVLQTVQQGTDQVLRQYGLSSATSQTSSGQTTR